MAWATAKLKSPDLETICTGATQGAAVQCSGWKDRGSEIPSSQIGLK